MVHMTAGAVPAGVGQLGTIMVEVSGDHGAIGTPVEVAVVTRAGSLGADESGADDGRPEGIELDGVLQHGEVEDGTEVCAGIDGEDGEDGATGAQDERGETGAQGVQGDKGDKGDKGDDAVGGVDGTNDTNGVDGEDDATGPQGPSSDRKARPEPTAPTPAPGGGGGGLWAFALAGAVWGLRRQRFGSTKSQRVP